MRRAHGFSLLEVLIATAILASGVTALAQLVTIAIRANVSARAATSAALLARAKMEQLRQLAWSVDATGAPVSDLTADIASEPNRPTGGYGLSASPPDALVQLRLGYCDFVDSAGRSLGGGDSPPPDAAYIRQWAVTPLDALADNTLLLQVRVTRRQGGGPSGTTIGIARRLDETWLVGIKTRKGG
jgi:prepilin-type N-terminal cleavage/methylation domain-containing protein